LITRGGYDWTKRYPWIVQAALKNRHKQFVIDGEAVILGVDGHSDFNALHAGRHNDEVQLYAFDFLALDGDDLRHLPLSTRTCRDCSHAGRDRPRSLPCRLQYWRAWSRSAETKPLSRRTLEGLGQLKNRLHPGNGASEGPVLMIEKHSTLSQPSSSSFTMAMVVRSF